MTYDTRDAGKVIPV